MFGKTRYQAHSKENSTQFVTTISESLKGINPFIQQLSGAKVLRINGQDPFVAVNANALITGSFQALGTRQNS